MTVEVVRGKWPKRGVTFDVQRGHFDISAAVMQRARESGDDFEIRRAFARGLEVDDEARVSRHEKREGGLRVYWRAIRVVSRAGSGGADRQARFR